MTFFGIDMNSYALILFARPKILVFFYGGVANALCDKINVQSISSSRKQKQAILETHQFSFHPTQKKIDAWKKYPFLSIK